MSEARKFGQRHGDVMDTRRASSHRQVSVRPFSCGKGGQRRRCAPTSMSPNDAVDGSSTRHVSAMDVGALLGLSRFVGARPGHRSSDAGADLFPSVKHEGSQNRCSLTSSPFKLMNEDVWTRSPALRQHSPPQALAAHSLKQAPLYGVA